MTSTPPQLPAHAADTGPLHPVPFTLDRLDEVVHIEQLSHSHPWSAGSFRDALSAGNHMVLWLNPADQLVGYVVAMAGVDEAHLLNITISPDHRGQGWAVPMLDALAAWAVLAGGLESGHSCGAQTLLLEVRASNARAQQVYERFGFKRIGLRKRYYPDTRESREDAVVMRLDLCANNAVPSNN